MGDEVRNNALLSKKTGKIYFVSEFGDSDELPDDIDDPDLYISIPNKYDLKLDKRIVFEFVSENVPEMEEIVSEIFRKKGAYSRYKDFLMNIGLLEKWYDFENQREKEALIKWCSKNGIEVFG